jgi:hypothetical protein
MITDSLASGHWRTCLTPPNARPAASAESARFFVTTYARDVVHAGVLNRDQADLVVAHYADVVGSDADVASEVTAEVWAARATELEGVEGGDEIKYDDALGALTAGRFAVRNGIDCCRDQGLQLVEEEHRPDDLFYAVIGLGDLMRISRGHRIDISFSYLDGAFPDLFPDELYARAAAGDRTAQATWMANIDGAEIRAGEGVAMAIREVAGLEVGWDGTNHDTVSVSVPHWRRQLPA